MLPFSSELNSAFPATAWSDVTRLCRRICVLREQGCADDAEALRVHTLAPLAARLHQDGAAEAEVSARLEAIMAAEAERVANAAVVAELLIPLLRKAPEFAGEATPGTIGRVIPAPLPTPVASPARAPASAPAPAAASIADFLDEMLAQESLPAAPGGPTRRRVS